MILYIDNRCLVNHENPDNDQIFAFFSMFYSNFTYMIQTLAVRRIREFIS
jgi:hypothetical protein